MIELKNNQLKISFQEVHSEACCEISFQRTLRIPDDNREYPLPPGLGNFPLQHVDDYASKLPSAWHDHGGLFLPMYQAEAMWIRFSGRYPFAIKIAAGKINAVSGARWDNELHDEPQDYVVIPDQPWLDGFCIGKELIRQFVAMPLGEGYTAEEQLTGAAEHGGIQIVAYPMKRDAYEAWSASKAESRDLEGLDYLDFFVGSQMGLAAGGLMRQQVFEDEYGLQVWDTTVGSRCFVHLLNSAQFSSVTGAKPPTKQPTAQDYTDAGLPWFDYYDENRSSLGGSSVLAGVDSIAAMSIKKGIGIMSSNEPVNAKTIVDLSSGGQKVREGKF